MKFRVKLFVAMAAFASLLVPGVAAAHVTVTPEEAPAEGYAMLTFTVPHGCDAAPTTSVSVKMPPQVVSATPGVVAGWDIKTKEGKLPEPVDQEGETVTEGVREVTWTGGPLPDGLLQQFPLSVALAGTEGDAAEFKVIQGCAGGAETAWIQSTPAGGEEPEHPAPTVVLDEPEDGHGAEADDGGEEADHAEAASSSDSDDDGSSDGLAIAALIVGGLGLLAGGSALVTARRSKQ